MGRWVIAETRWVIAETGVGVTRNAVGNSRLHPQFNPHNQAIQKMVGNSRYSLAHGGQFPIIDPMGWVFPEHLPTTLTTLRGIPTNNNGLTTQTSTAPTE